MTTAIFVLRSLDGIHLQMFANVDAALDVLADRILGDADLDDFELSRYVLNPQTHQYLFDHTYDIAELMDVASISESESTAKSYILTDDDSSVACSEEEQI